MSRNFPAWEQTHWDYEKGNLDEASKRYALGAARRVHQAGGRIHFFVVGRVFEQQDVGWLAEIAEQGHPIGNHTYDHVYILAKSRDELQFRFRRAPWLLGQATVPEAIVENVRLTELAMKRRIGVPLAGFRAPGGFAAGLADRPDVQQMLQSLGYQWVSTKYPSHLNTEAGTRPDDALYEAITAAAAHAQPFVYPTGLVEVPMCPISDIGAFRTGRWPLEDFLEAIRRTFAWTVAHGACFDFLAHPSCLGVVDPEFRAIDLLLELAQEHHDRVEIVDLGTMARRAQQTAAADS